MSEAERYYKLQGSYQKTFLTFNGGVLVATLTFVEGTQAETYKLLVGIGLSLVFISVILLLIELFVTYVTSGSEAMKLISGKQAFKRGELIASLMLYGLLASLVGTALIALFVLVNI